MVEVRMLGNFLSCKYLVLSGQEESRPYLFGGPLPALDGQSDVTRHFSGRFRDSKFRRILQCRKSTARIVLKFLVYFSFIRVATDQTRSAFGRPPFFSIPNVCHTSQEQWQGKPQR